MSTHMETVEPQLRAALRVSLEQYARAQSGQDQETSLVRGRRKELIEEVIEPLRNSLEGASYDRLLKALTLVMGIEALVVLKDLWRINGTEATNIMRWAAQSLLDAAQRSPRHKGTVDRAP